ncbi:MAG: hypothetical protein EOO73_14275 [Myxococcales bacterium]|nr:MAG: hypothetical protein EOO73_14275 [Myxococcales bacterium]
MRHHPGLVAWAALVLASCAPPEERAAGSITAAVGSASCSVTAPCSGNFVCVENAAGPGQHRCEASHALYSFLDREPDSLSLAFEQMLGVWRTERARTSLSTVAYPLQLESGENVGCKDSDSAASRPCRVPDWQAYVDPSGIADKYDRFALFGLRPIRFLVTAWRHETDARLSAMASSRGLSMSPATIRANMRAAYLAALDSFTTAVPLPFALPSDPAPSMPAGWMSPNAPFDAGLALWDAGYNYNCKIEKSVSAPGYPGLSYYDLRSSLWDRHATAFRALSLLNGYFHARGLLSGDQTERWLAAMRRDADALALSGSFEPGANHGITEAAALLQLATELDGTSAPALAPTASLTAAWKDLALQRLNAVISQTLLADGAQVEQSLFYHAYELSFLVEIQDWMRRHPEVQLSGVGGSQNQYDFAICQNGSTFDHRIVPDPSLSLAARVQAATRVAAHTAMPSLEVPMLGSSPMSNLGFWETSFDAYVAGDPSEVVQQLQFARTQGAKGLPIPLSQRMQVFPVAGYVTLRSAFSPSYAAQTHVLFNAGAPANAHSHLDALALHLYAQDPTTPEVDGLPLLADSGWFSYTSPQRHYFESTAAHSTVSVDGLNQCSFEPLGKRADPTVAASALPSCADLNDGYAPSRGHLGTSVSDPTGYDRVLYQSAEVSLNAGVVHRRAVALFGRDVLLVLDQLQSSQPRTFQQNWQLAPSIKSVVSQGAADGTAHYAFHNASGASLFSGHFGEASDSVFAAFRATCGTCTGDSCAGSACADPRQGWYSVAENTKAPAWMLQRRRSTSEVAWASAFLLGSAAAQRARVELKRSGAERYGLDVTLDDGMPLSLQISSFASPNEAVVIGYPLRGAFASYSFEGQPGSVQDLKEGLSVNISVPGETTDNVVARPGLVGNAYEYVAGGSELGSGGSFAFMHKPDARFSLSFWMRMSSSNLGATGGTQAILSTATWSGAGTGIQVYFQDDATRNNTLRFVVRGSGGTPLSFSSPPAFVPEDTLWHHYVLVFEASAPSDQIRVYRDGSHKSVGQFSGALSPLPNDATPTIGKKPGSGVAYPLRASLDELVVFKRALSDSEAAGLHNAGTGMRAH